MTSQIKWQPERSATETILRACDAIPEFINHSGRALTAFLRLLVLIPAAACVVVISAAVWMDRWLLIAAESSPTFPEVHLIADTSEFDLGVRQVRGGIERLERDMRGAQ